ncbi:MAG: hypothetical protein ACI9XU_000009 [Arenicella sp.]|jgi:hypothetical protein
MNSNSKKSVNINILRVPQNTALKGTKEVADSKQSSLDADVAGADIETSSKQKKFAKEINGPKGLEPTRYGDWEAKGRCCDF